MCPCVCEDVDANRAPVVVRDETLKDILLLRKQAAGISKPSKRQWVKSALVSRERCS